jgi:hypothetical protein
MIAMTPVSNPAKAAPRATGRRIGRRVRFASFAVALGLILYFELKPQPAVADTPFMPRAMGRFFDAHDFLNNVLGFAVLTAATHFAFAGGPQDNVRRISCRAALVAFGILALECLQLVIPNRNSDWHDVAAGWLGVAGASAYWFWSNRAFSRDA